MNPPDRETTLEAMERLNQNGLFRAAEAWSRIAPDANGEWDDELVDALARGLPQPGVLTKKQIVVKVLTEIGYLRGGDDAD